MSSYPRYPWVKFLFQFHPPIDFKFLGTYLFRKVLKFEDLIQIPWVKIDWKWIFLCSGNCFCL